MSLYQSDRKAYYREYKRAQRQAKKPVPAPPVPAPEPEPIPPVTKPSTLADLLKDIGL